MKYFIFILFFLPAIAFCQAYVADEDSDLPKMEIRIEGDDVLIKGKVGVEYKTQFVRQHSEIYFDVPNSCSCGVKSGQYSGALAGEILELFTPYFGVLQLRKIQP